MNSFGKNFRLTIFGESHGPMIGVVMDGVPAGITLSVSDFEVDLARRWQRPLRDNEERQSDHNLSAQRESCHAGSSRRRPGCSVVQAAAREGLYSSPSLPGAADCCRRSDKNKEHLSTSERPENRPFGATECSVGVTARAERDIPEIVSGVFEGRTTGAPLTVVFRNEDVQSADYKQFTAHPRPSHADLVAAQKFGGYNDPRGGGHFSGRLTVCLVAAGVVARKVLANNDLCISSEIVELGGSRDKNSFAGILAAARADGDSVGAVVECKCSHNGSPEPGADKANESTTPAGGVLGHMCSGRPTAWGGVGPSGCATEKLEQNVGAVEFGSGQENDSRCCARVARTLPQGLGEPFFDAFEGVLSHLLFAIPGVRGVEFGAGFAAAAMRGSEHNDPIINELGATATNNSGGVVGGLTNGNEIVFRVAFKPTASIARPQKTYNFDTQSVDTLEITGRHDTCIALRAAVVVEAALAIVMADFARGN